MKRKIMMLHRLTTARKRMRDIASSASQHAEEARLQAERVEMSAQSELETLLDDAEARFAAASHANELLMFAREHAHAKTALEGARTAADRRRSEAEKKRAILAERARELKTSERVRDRLVAELDSKIKQSEQKTADDLAAAKHGRSS